LILRIDKPLLTWYTICGRNALWNTITVAVALSEYVREGVVPMISFAPLLHVVTYESLFAFCMLLIAFAALLISRK